MRPPQSCQGNCSAALVDERSGCEDNRGGDGDAAVAGVWRGRELVPPFLGQTCCPGRRPWGAFSTRRDGVAKEEGGWAWRVAALWYHHERLTRHLCCAACCFLAVLLLSYLSLSPTPVIAWERGVAESDFPKCSENESSKCDSWRAGDGDRTDGSHYPAAAAAPRHRPRSRWWAGHAPGSARARAGGGGALRLCGSGRRGGGGGAAGGGGACLQGWWPCRRRRGRSSPSTTRLLHCHPRRGRARARGATPSWALPRSGGAAGRAAAPPSASASPPTSEAAAATTGRPVRARRRWRAAASAVGRREGGLTLQRHRCTGPRTLAA